MDVEKIKEIFPEDDPEIRLVEWNIKKLIHGTYSEVKTEVIRKKIDPYALFILIYSNRIDGSFLDSVLQISKKCSKFRDYIVWRGINWHEPIQMSIQLNFNK